MKKIVAFLVFLFPLSCPAAIFVIDDENNTINSEQTWTSGNTYHVTDSLTITSTGSLTIEPGTFVKLATVSMNVQGVLDVNGTAGSPVIFTSDDDDTVGEDTTPGMATVGAPGSVRGISISGQAQMDYADLRFIGNTNTSYDAAIGIQPGSTVSLVNCAISDVQSPGIARGIRIIDADPLISNCAFNRAGSAAMSMTLDSDPTIVAPTFTATGVHGVVVDFGTASGDLVLDDPDVVYELVGVTIQAGSTFTIVPGQVIKTSVSIQVDGTINAEGTSGSPIIFTSHEDDSAGGDTNWGDGPGISPAAGNWQGMRINGVGTLDHVEFRYAGNTNSSYDSTLRVDGQASISNCRIQDSDTIGISTFGADVTIDNCVFENSARAAISSDPSSQMTVTAPTFNNNAVNGWEMRGGTTTRDIVWDSPDVVIAFEGGTVTVGAGQSLTLGAGQVIKPANNFFVQGTLLSQGTATAPVIMTSRRDDSAGGDTNNDGPTEGVPGDWSALWSDAGVVNLEHTRLRFGGTTNSSARSLLRATNMGQITANALVIDQPFTGGISCVQTSQVSATNVIISRGRDEGVLASDGCSVSLTNATISNFNIAVEANAASVNLVNASLTHSSFRAVDVFGGGDVTLAHSNLFESAAVSGIADPIGQNGNISADPRYVSARSGDFRLLDHSGLIDAAAATGAPPLDLLGNARFDDLSTPNSGAGMPAFVDIGAIERQDGIPGALLLLDGNVGSGDRLGASVSADGNRIAVGVPNADVEGVDDGRVLIFERNGDRFELVSTIDVPDPYFALNFGSAVSLQGGKILIGASGTSTRAAMSMPQAQRGNALQAALFELVGQDWILKTPITPISGNADDQFGASVSLDGDLAIVGAPGDDDNGSNAGAVHVFEIGGSAIIDSFKLTPSVPNAGAAFGAAVVCSNGRIAVGAPGGELAGVASGTVSLFERISARLADLSETVTITGSTSDADDQFGHSVGLDEDQLVVGAPMADDEGSDSGAAFVFDPSGSELGRLVPESATGGDLFGMAVAIGDERMVVGAPGMNAGIGAVLRFDQSSRRQLEQLDGAADGIGFGTSVARSSNLLAVGAPDTDSQQGEAFARVVDVRFIFADRFE